MESSKASVVALNLPFGRPGFAGASGVGNGLLGSIHCQPHGTIV